jgi:hypothetical protein
MSFYQYILVGIGGAIGAISRVVASRILHAIDLLRKAFFAPEDEELSEAFATGLMLMQ